MFHDQTNVGSSKRRVSHLPLVLVGGGDGEEGAVGGEGQRPDRRRVLVELAQPLLVHLNDEGRK